VEDVSVSGVNMSVFANVANNVTIEGCSVSATLTRKGTNASVIGGLIGSLATAKSDTSVIRNCTVELTCDAKTTGGSMSSTFGGFIGKIISADNNSASSYATVENCTVKGSIVTTGGGKGTVTGGFVGSVGKDSKLTTFRNCVADMTLNVTGDNQTAVGGFIGRTDGWQYTQGSNILMESCMVRGTVTTSSAVVGGVVGNLTNAGLTLTGVYVDGAFESTADAATVGILSGTHTVLNNHLTKSSALYSPLAISLIGSDNADAVLNADQRVFVTGADFDAAQVAAYTAVLNEIANDAGAGAWYLSSAKGMPVPATALKVSGMRAVLTDGIALQFYVIGASGLSAADIVLMDEEGHTYTGETAVVGGKDAILFTVNDIQVVNLTETVSYRIAVRNIEGAEVLRISLLDYLAAIWQKDDTGSKEKALIETMVNFAYYYAVDSGVADPTVVTDFNRLAGASLTPSVDGAEDTISATGISGVTASLDFRGGVQLIIVSSGVVSAGAGYDVNQSGDQNVIGGLTLADMNRGIPLTIDGVSYNGFTIGTVLLAMINANQQADLARAAALYMNAAAEYAAQAQN